MTTPDPDPSEAAPGLDAVRRDHGYHRLIVKAVVDETPDARSFVLDVPPELAAAFAYRPGQFCTLRVPVGGQEHLRSYSMSSAPETDDDLTVTVKRVPGGVVSNWLNDHLGVGDAVEATRPAGVFCPGGTGRPVVALCGGSGVTPVMSIVKSVLGRSRRSVRLLYANRDRGSVIFDAALRELEDRHPDRLAVVRHFDTDGGFLDAAAVRAFVAPSLDADFYVCGPAPFMDLVESTLHEAGVDPAAIFIERFLVDGPAPHVADGAPPDGAPVPTEVTLILGGRTTVVPYQPGDTVLETARRGALRPPFSCEAGNCATCMAFVREGRVRMRANNALSAEEVDEGWILTCQSLPTSATLCVEYEAM